MTRSQRIPLESNVIDYHYDSLSRLIEADYNNGTNVYDYGYDEAGNLVNYDGVTRTYNATNQMTNDGTNALTYDNNGNLRTVGSDTYTWDRANRLLSVGNHSYVYDGLGNRIQQTVSSVVTDYLNDMQPGLTKLLKLTTGANVEHFVHAPRGIHAVDDGTDWNFYAQDGLGSVRAVVDDMAVVQGSMSFDPYGNPIAAYGAGFGFTGEQTDENDNIYLRARYMNPNMGTFLNLDPFEGVQNRPMSLNGYSWVEGNVTNAVDPTGMDTIEVWAAAFIAEDFITFLYPRAESYNYSYGTNVTAHEFDLNLEATWHGDNRQWYEGSGINTQDPPSSRVWFHVVIDTERGIGMADVESGVGRTYVTYQREGGDGDLITRDDVASKPSEPIVSCVGDTYNVTIDAAAENPLIDVSPAIQIGYEITYRPSGDIFVTARRDRYPWHELYVAVDGDQALALRQSPLGPSISPFDLGLPAIKSFHSETGLPSVPSCQESQIRGKRASILPNEMKC